MRNPYTVLGLKRESTTDEDVRKAWLEKVRRFPPETHPEQFRECRQAYEALKTKKDRLRELLISTDTNYDSPFEALSSVLKDCSKRTPPSHTNLHKMINETFKTVYTNNSNKRKM
ncbi:MAG: hypothetical protein ACOC41_07745 [Chitinivibrionales bacterium]